MSKLITTIVGRTAVLLLVGLPLALMFLSAFRGPPDVLPFETKGRWTLENFRYFYGDSSLYDKVLPDTFLFATLSTAGAFIVGLFLAYVVECCAIRRKALLTTILVLPLAIPTPSIALTWINILGPNAGIVNRLFRQIGWMPESGSIVNVFSMFGLIWCQVLATAPFAFLLLRPALRARRQSCEEAAYLSGAGAVRTFFQITIGHVRPLLLAPLVVLFVVSIEQVDFPLMLGGGANISVLGTRLFWEFNSPVGLPNIGAICAASVPIVVLAVIGLWAFDKLTRSGNRFQSVGVAERGELRLLRGWSKCAVNVSVGAYVLLCVILPVFFLVIAGFTTKTGIGWSDYNWNVAALRAILVDDRITGALTNSLILATTVGIGTTCIGAALALTRSGTIGLSKRWAEYLAMMSTGVPATVVAAAIGTVFLFLPWGIYGSMWILIFALCYRLALATGMAEAAISQLHKNVLEAAEVAGATWTERSLRIAIPLTSPALIATAGLLMVVAARELTMPLMLSSPENVVVPAIMMQLRQAGMEAEAAICGIVLGVICMIALVISINAESWISVVKKHALC